MWMLCIRHEPMRNSLGKLLTCMELGEPPHKGRRLEKRLRRNQMGMLLRHSPRRRRHLKGDCYVTSVTVLVTYSPPEEVPGHTTPKNNNGASSNVVTNQSTTLDKEKQCEQHHRQWAEAEYQRIKGSLQMDTVTGSVGPLYYCQLLVAGQLVTALVDSGSSATIMSLELFQEVAKKAGLSSEILHKLDVFLHDYNQHPLRVGAVANLEIEYGDKNVIAPVYINAGHGQSHEPFLCGTNILLYRRLAYM